MENKSNPCIDELSDSEYLIHMIPHHQVAIDMSELLIKVSKNPTMLHLCRDIIRKQSYEIWEMTMMKEKLSGIITSDEPRKRETTKTILDIYYPKLSKSSDGDCDPLFFKPDEHMSHMEHMEINDTSYLIHMIAHHQVAIDMSKRLLLHTDNDYLLDFCRKLIIDQQGEIFTMNHLLKNTYIHESELL